MRSATLIVSLSIPIAASLLFASGIGIGVALSRWVAVIGVSILGLVILRGFPYIEQKIGTRT